MKWKIVPPMRAIMESTLQSVDELILSIFCLHYGKYFSCEILQTPIISLCTLHAQKNTRYAARGRVDANAAYIPAAKLRHVVKLRGFAVYFFVFFWSWVRWRVILFVLKRVDFTELPEIPAGPCLLALRSQGNNYDT